MYYKISISIKTLKQSWIQYLQIKNISGLENKINLLMHFEIHVYCWQINKKNINDLIHTSHTSNAVSTNNW